jgi:DNA-binding HxlR family transcriptional regulator
VTGVVEGLRLRAPASIADLLRLLADEPNGAIILALGAGPLRTGELTSRIPGSAPRTIYRHLKLLVSLGLLERQEERAAPTRVSYRLSRPAGRDLCHLLHTFAAAVLPRLPDGGVDRSAWASLGRFADLWALRIVEELGHGSRTPTELSRSLGALSYHQADRLTSLVGGNGLLRPDPAAHGRRAPYNLTTQARRDVALVLGLARWRHRHPPVGGGASLGRSEMAAALRATLPLARLPEWPGRRLAFTVSEPSDGPSETAWMQTGPDGTLAPDEEGDGRVDARAQATMGVWIAALLDGRRGRLRTAGELDLLDACLTRLHARLVSPERAARPPCQGRPV